MVDGAVGRPDVKAGGVLKVLEKSHLGLTDRVAKYRGLLQDVKHPVYAGWPSVALGANLNKTRQRVCDSTGIGTKSETDQEVLQIIGIIPAV